jgi:hypothetical protein
MTVFEADTAKEMRDDIVEFLKRDAHRQRMSVRIYTKKSDKALCEARAKALESAADYLQSANIVKKGSIDRMFPAADSAVAKR